MTDNLSWKLKARLQTILTGIFYQKKFSDAWLPSTDKEWVHLDVLVSNSRETLPELPEGFCLSVENLNWFITNFRCFPGYAPHFFRQVEVLHGLVFLAAQKARLMAALLKTADPSWCYPLELHLKKQAYLTASVFDKEPATILSVVLQELTEEKRRLSEAGLDLKDWFEPQIQFVANRLSFLSLNGELVEPSTDIPVEGFDSVLMEEIHKLGKENQNELEKLLLSLHEELPIADVMNTEQIFLYEEESRRSRWNLDDVLDLCKKQGRLDLTDNDYELLDVLKELAYCEAVAYSISYNNQCHLGLNSPFMLWNLLQAHEEVKHFHVIRAVLNYFGINTENLNEKFLADSYELPGPEWFHNQYAVFTINFLGEVHNIRAYRLLAKSFDSPFFKKIMQMIIDDEVVHKKLFAAHYRYEANRIKDYTKNLCESILEEGLEMHQARISPHYRILMQKIGRYYNNSGKASALEFLNQSMKSQYLELKNLLPREEFKISEFEFRRRHLRAYAF
ncbi:MAG: ferritin-like domain-containing protein [Candidatus Cloacimonetes bacterium]|nr:ferritin-like domain-containing protein [Candidatus Cloacimonadota bacterium]